MARIPAKVAARLSAGVKRFQPVLASAQARDVNESDTVVIVTDIMADVLGYDKYADISSEHMIRSTFCDLALKIDGDLALLVEVKAIGHDLKDSHVKQAVDYAANKGCEWVALTNARSWRVYRILFTKPIEAELIADIDFGQISPRKDGDLELLWLLSKEGWRKSRLNEYAAQQEALSRFTIAAILTSDACLALLRREIRRASPEAKVEIDQIAEVLCQDVLKREVLEGDKASAESVLLPEPRSVSCAIPVSNRSLQKPTGPARAEESTQHNRRLLRSRPEALGRRV